MPASAPLASVATETNSNVDSGVSLSRLAAELTETVRLRSDYMIAQGNLDRQIKRIVSRLTGQSKIADRDVVSYMESASGAFLRHLKGLTDLRDHAEVQRRYYDKACEKLAAALPVNNSFVETVPGFGLIGLALIVGEAGDLGGYSGPAKLWKRFGLHVMAGRSGATWMRKGGLSKDQWSDFGYSPRRRAVMFVIVDSLLQNTKNAYRAVYLAAKDLEVEKAKTEGLIVAPAADIPDGEAGKYRSLKHIDLRARRKVAKRLLKDLWRAWRGHTSGDPHSNAAPAPSQPETISGAGLPGRAAPAAINLAPAPEMIA